MYNTSPTKNKKPLDSVSGVKVSKTGQSRGLGRQRTTCRSIEPPEPGGAQVKPPGPEPSSYVRLLPTTAGPEPPKNTEGTPLAPAPFGPACLLLPGQVCEAGLFILPPTSRPLTFFPPPFHSLWPSQLSLRTAPSINQQPPHQASASSRN